MAVWYGNLEMFFLLVNLIILYSSAGYTRSESENYVYSQPETRSEPDQHIIKLKEYYYSSIQLRENSLISCIKRDKFTLINIQIYNIFIKKIRIFF